MGLELRARWTQWLDDGSWRMPGSTASSQPLQRCMATRETGSTGSSGGSAARWQSTCTRSRLPTTGRSLPRSWNETVRKLGRVSSLGLGQDSLKIARRNPALGGGLRLAFGCAQTKMRSQESLVFGIDARLDLYFRLFLDNG